MSTKALQRRTRILGFLSLLLICVSLCFSQYGIVVVGKSMGVALNVTLFLIPVAIGIAVLGPLEGMALAVVTGICIMLRTQWTPTTPYDVRLADPFLSLLSVTLGALGMTVVVTLAARRWSPDLASETTPIKRLGRPRVIMLVVGCLVLSAVYSYASRGLAYLFISPGGTEYGYASTVAGYLESLKSPTVLIETILNAAILSVPCVLIPASVAHYWSGTWKSPITSTFNRWLAIAMVIVFMISSSFLFCLETVRSTEAANELLMGELSYLQAQVNDRMASDDSITSVASGYATAFDGTVAVVRNRTIVSSNNAELVGQPAGRLFDTDSDERYDFIVQSVTDHMLSGVDENGRFYGVRALVDENFTYIEDAPLDVVFRSRTDALRYNAWFLVSLLVALFAMVYMLMHTVVVTPIRRTNDTLGLITNGELTRRVNERRTREFDLLSNGINTTVEALKDNMDEVVRRNARDMATAKKIQESTLPREFPPFPNIDRFDLYASMRPAREVGGDFYDFFLLDDDRLGFLVADVSGKGIPAAMFMMTARTQVRTHILAGLPLEEAIAVANHQICLENDARMFVTMYVCILNYKTGELVYVNAGHNPPVYSHDGTCEWVTDISALPLGIIDGVSYARFERTLVEGDLLYLYSDGVNEAMDVDNQPFGDDRLMETIASNTSLNARSICGAMRRAVTEYTAGAEQSDDITMLAIRYGVPPEGRAFIELSASVGQLVHAQKFIHEELHRRNAPQRVRNSLDIAIEELFCNVCRHAYPNATPDAPGEVRIEYEYHDRPSTLRIALSDDGVPFDPLDESTPIGLGIRMARGHVDEMGYERVGSSNVVRLVKRW